MITRRHALCALLVAPMTAPTPVWAEGPLRLRDLYNKDLSFSDVALARDGRRIDVDGYMAPPLKAEAEFFVLTLRPLAVCPFCDTEVDWPADILAVYTKRPVEVVSFNAPIRTTGVLRLNTMTDAQTGFVSRVRLEDATVARL